jgi:hypothetical protein
MKNKFKEGTIVSPVGDPKLKLLIRRYVDMIYYCQVQNDPSAKEQVYFERELSSDA